MDLQLAKSFHILDCQHEKQFCTSCTLMYSMNHYLGTFVYFKDARGSSNLYDVGSIRFQPPTFLELESRSSFEKDLLVCTSKGRIFNQCRKFFILHQFWLSML